MKKICSKKKVKNLLHFKLNISQKLDFLIHQPNPSPVWISLLLSPLDSNPRKETSPSPFSIPNEPSTKPFIYGTPLAPPGKRDEKKNPQAMSTT